MTDNTHASLGGTPTGQESTDNIDNSAVTGSTDAIQAEIDKLEASSPGSSQAAPPAAPTDPAAPKVDPTKSDPEKASRLIQQAKAEQALRREQKAFKAKLEASEKAAQERISAAEQKAAELEAIQTGLNSKEGIDAFFKRTGLDFQKMVTAYYYGDEVKPVDNASKALSEVESLKAQLAEQKAEREAAIKAERDKQQKSQQQAAYQNTITQVQAYIHSKPDDYELIADGGDQAVAEVLNRTWAWMQENKDQPALQGPLSDEDEKALIDHISSQYEAELLEHAKNMSQRLAKLKKLTGIGITPNTSNNVSGLPATVYPSSVPANVNLSASEAELLSQLQGNLGGYRKFLTNDASTGPAPVAPATQPTNGRVSRDAELERLIEQYK